MKVLNIHKRTISQPKKEVDEIFHTLATKNDGMLATDLWHPMKLNNGIEIGSKGGHGPIRYTVIEHIPNELIVFKFSKPKGFNGIHKFELKEIDNRSSEIKHTIDMSTSIQGSILWLIAIRWLHDAFTEDALDKIENNFLENKKKSNWSLWVRMLRSILKPRNKKNR